jgi:hypothetical protein
VVAYFKLNPNICLEELKNQFHVVVHFWGANSRLISYDIYNSLRNPKIHYNAHKSPPLGPVN